VAVGAPFHSDYTTETYESGAVYVHYQNPQVGIVIVTTFYTVCTISYDFH